MNRREFIASLGWATIASPVAVRAQPPKRIGVLMFWPESDPERRSEIDAFRMRLDSLGWHEGRNLQADYRWAGADLDLLRHHAADLLKLNPDVIYATGTPSTMALFKLTRTVPIVFAGAQNPIGSGFAVSLARPGGNITGFVDFEPSLGGKWVELLKEIAPTVTRIGFPFNPQTHTGQYFEAAQAAARSLSISPTPLPYRETAELARALETFAQEPNSGIVVMPDNSANSRRETFVRLSLRLRLPSVFAVDLFVREGGLAFYGIDREDRSRKSAEYVDRILRGEKPADLPIQGATRYQLGINLKTAKQFGLTVPATVLARADEVIE